MRGTCSIDGCGLPLEARGYCNKHYTRLRKHGDVNYQRRREFGSGNIENDGRIIIGVNYGRKYLHVLIAEKAIGRELPSGAEVHHVDGNPANNDPSNLVICPSRAYHKLLHKRQRAFDAIGNANYRKCEICKCYSDPNDMTVLSSGPAYHKECKRLQSKVRYAEHRESINERQRILYAQRKKEQK